MRAPGSLLGFVAVLLGAAPASAEPGHTRAVTVGAAAVAPLPPWHDTGFGAAPWVGFVPASWRTWNLTARAGWIGHVDKQQTVGSEAIRYRGWEIPVLVGVEYSRRAEQGLVLAAELGYVLHHTRSEYRHQAAVTATDHRAGLSLGGGYRVGDFQVRLQYFMLGLPDPVKHKALVFGVQWALPI